MQILDWLEDMIIEFEKQEIVDPGLFIIELYPPVSTRLLGLFIIFELDEEPIDWQKPPTIKFLVDSAVDVQIVENEDDMIVEWTEHITHEFILLNRELYDPLRIIFEHPPTMIEFDEDAIVWLVPIAIKFLHAMPEILVIQLSPDDSIIDCDAPTMQASVGPPIIEL